MLAELRGNMLAEVIEHPSRATSEWLSNVLGRAVEVDSIEPLEGGVVSATARVVLACADEPRSVVVKCAPEDAERRLELTRQGSLHSEVRFYDEIGAIAGLPIPYCWYAGFRLSDGHCTLVLEDLAPRQPGDSDVGLTVDQVRTAVVLIARMHSRFWGSTRSWPWLAENAANRTGGALERAAERAPDVLARYGDRLPASITPLLEDMRAQVLKAAARGAARFPITLVHGDCRAENIAFGVEASEMRFFDWQLVRAGQPGTDLVPLVNNSLTVEQRRDFGDDMVYVYCDAMAAAGIKLEADEVRAAFHDALIEGLIPMVNVLSRGEPGSAGEHHALRALQRLAASIEDGW